MIVPLLALCVLGVPSAHAQALNPDFDTDLSSWVISEHAGAFSAGTVTWDAGAALISEGDSQLVVLEQRFSLPMHPSTLSFDLDLTPGLDTIDGFFPDVFEAYLIDDNRNTLVGSWQIPDAGAFFTLREDGSVELSPGGSYDGVTVSLDVSSLPSGQQVTLVMALVGADNDTSSAVRIDGLDVGSANLPPVADAGDDLSVACDSETFTLDATRSYDPHGDPITAVWTDEAAAVLGTDFTLDVDPPFALGVSDYTVSVTDALGLMSFDTAEVTIFDAEPPMAPSGPLFFDVDEAGTCGGEVPDLSSLISPTDNCGAVTIVQDILVGTVVAVGASTPVILTSEDAAGNTSETLVVVSVVDPDGSCGVPIDTSHTGLFVSLDTSDTSVTNAGATGDTAKTPGGDTGPTVTGGTADTSGGQGTSHTADTNGPLVTGGTADTSGDSAQADTSQDTDGSTSTDTDPPTDTDPTTDPTDTDPDPTTQPNGNVGDNADTKTGNCGCASGPSAGSGLALAWLALWGLGRRRRELSALAFVMFFLGISPSASAQTPIDFGDDVAGTVTVDDQVDVYTFTAAPGQRVFVGNPPQISTGVRYRLLDDFARELRTGLIQFDLGPVKLMGGDYKIEVFGGSIGDDYEFFLGDAPVTDRGAIALDVDVPGNMSTVGELHRYTVTLPGEAYLVGTPVTSFLGNWRLSDEYGQLISDELLWASFGPLHLPGGVYTLDIENLENQPNNYTIRLDALSVAPAQATTIGSTLIGLAANNSVLDRWEFPAVAGQSLFVELVDGSWSDTWTLLDPQGNAIDSGYAGDEGGGPYVLSDGIWALELEPSSGAVDDYEFVLVDVPASLVEPLTIDVPMSQHDTTVGQGVDYPFTALAGERVRLENSWSRPDVDWTLVSADGRVFDLPGSEPAPVTLEGGDYTLSMVPLVPDPGSVRYTLISSVDTFQPVGLGDTLAGSAGSGATNYTFVAAPGQMIDLDVSWTTEDYTLYDGLDRVIVQDDQDLQGIALMGGAYRLELTDGSWSIDLLDAGFSAFVPSGLPASLGVEAAGTLTAGLDDDYTLDLATDTTVFFDLHSGVFGLEWTVLDPQDQAVFPMDLAFSDRHSKGPYTLAAGIYTVRLHSPGGLQLPYAFQAEDVSLSLDTPVVLDQLYADTISIPGEERQYTLDLAAPTDVYLVLEAGGLDVAFSMVDSVGESVFATEDNEKWGEGPFRLGAGSYVITADPAHNWMPAYELQIYEVSGRIEPISIGDLVDVAFDMPGQTVSYTFTATEGQSAFFDVTTGGNADWALTSVDGLQYFAASMASDSDDQGPIALGAGQWSLEVRSSDAEMPTPAFQILDVPAAPPPTPMFLDTPVVGTFTTPGEQLRFALDLATFTRVDLHSTTDPEVTWSLVDPIGEPVFEDAAMADYRGPRWLAAGTYVLTIWATAGDLVDYEFTAQQVVDTTRPLEFFEIVEEPIAHVGQQRHYTFTIPPDSTIQEDRIFADLAMEWWLVDSVGETVSEARSMSGYMLSNLLAPGDYELVIDDPGLGTTDYSFKIREGRPDDRLFYYSIRGIPGFGSPSPNIKRATYRFDGLDYNITGEFAIASTLYADGLLVAPDGDLVTGAVYSGMDKINAESGAFTTISTPIAYHVALDPSGDKIWVTPTLKEVSMIPFGPAVQRTVTGDESNIDSLAFDRAGQGYYVEGSSFGRIDMDTLVTTRLSTGLTGVHSLSFDPFTDTMLMFGDEYVTQLDMETGAVTAQLVVPGMDFDQGSSDGYGHAFIASATGYVVMVDFSATGRVDAPQTKVHAEYLDDNMDDIAPMAWLGSGCSAAAPVQIAEPAYDSVLPVGQVVAVSGRYIPDDPTTSLVGVLIDGVPATSIDVAGNFFGVHTVVAGPHSVHVEWWDRCGKGDTYVAIAGGNAVGNQPSAADAVNTHVTGHFDKTTWVPGTTQLRVLVSAENTSDDGLVGPLYMAVGAELEPDVVLANAVGQTVEGLPYIEVLGTGVTLDPGETTPEHTLVFHDPQRSLVRFDPQWLATGNRAPRFTSAPTTRVVAGQPWEYDADAVDDDGHTVTYRLDYGPPGLALFTDSGVASWTPALADVGVYPMQIAATDGYGGETIQQFVLTVDAGNVNTPPIFATAPVTQIDIGTSLLYQAEAVDNDGDPIQYALDLAPAGMVVDVATGEVTWTVTAPGVHPIELRADDGRGGSAVQSWSLTVGVATANPHGPILTSAPPLVAGVDDLYFYQPIAYDRDGDALTWSLLVGPAMMDINAANGRIMWTPAAADIGSVPVTLEVSDGLGASVRQSWEIVVGASPVNRAPIFSSLPPVAGLVGAPWTYPAVAVDPEGDVVGYTLALSPPGAVIDPVTGVVDWTPALPDVGLATFSIEASDGLGATSTQAFFVDVRGGNQAPVVLSGPPAPVVVGAPFQHHVVATDADGDALTHSLSSGPPGLTIDPLSGRMIWLTTVADAGLHPVVVQVSDPYGGLVIDAWDIDVVFDSDAPIVEIFPNWDPACIDEAVRICVNASDDTAVVAQTLQADAVPLVLDAMGCGDLVPTGAGVLALDATATDGGGNVGFAAANLTVIDCSDPLGLLPEIVLVDPLDGASVAAPTDVVASVILDPAATLVDWSAIAYPKGGDPAEATVLGGGAGALPPSLGLFDPTLIDNGLWTLEIEAQDSFGRTVVSETTMLVEGNMKLGSYDVAFVDASWTASVTSLSMVRSYSTLRKDQIGDFGHGWDLDVVDVEVQMNGPLGDGGWSQADCGVGGLYVPVCTTSSKPHLVVVKWAGGAVESFDFTPAEGLSWFPGVTGAAYTARPGTFSTLRPVAGQDTVAFSGDGNLYTDLGGHEIFDPTQFVLTTGGGIQLLLDVEDGLLEITQRSGNQTRFTENGIFPDYGIGVTWTRDGQERIEQMQLGDGTTIDYGYDPAGDLVTVTDQAGDVVQFVYDGEHRLVSYNDAGHGPVSINAYDADGRLISSDDPGGAFLTYSHDLRAWTETVVGPDPRLTTTTTFNADGLTERLEQSVVIGPNPGKVGEDEDLHREWSWQYDDDFNVIAEDGPGGIDTFEYDEDGRLVGAEDTEGNEVEYLYDTYGNVLQMLINDESVGVWVYNEVGKLIEVLSATGETLYTLTYDEDHFLRSITDADGLTVMVTVDGSGNVEGVGMGGIDVSTTSDGMARVEIGEDAAGNLTHVEYDERGALLALIDANGNAQRWEYDERGLLLRALDKAGRSTHFEWDDKGRLERVITRTDDVVSYTYDTIGQLVGIDGGDAFVNVSYDALGRVIALENAEQIISFEWGIEDELLQIDSGGITMDSYPFVSHNYIWSNAGFLESVVSPYGAINYSYDNKGLPVQQDDSLGGIVNYQWGNDGRLGAVERLPSGLVSQFTYTDAGRLERTTTLEPFGLIQDDTIQYGPQGYIAAVTDNFGTHLYDYDVLGQLTVADHPPASGIPDELYAYDTIGNRTEWAGHAPAEVVYDAEDRLIQDADWLYTYDDEGRLIEQEDRDAGYITEYHWNTFSQLVRVVNPDGTETHLAYDPLGRRVEIDDDGEITRFGWDGGEIRMIFDGRNELQSWESTDIFGELMSKYDAIAGTTDQTLLNHLGSVTGSWDGGAMSWDPRDSFGNSAGGGGGLSPHALTWHSQDPSGLIYARARYIDPKSGRFISQDPIVSTNQYAYALNNPLTYWDPYGLTAATEEGTQDSLITLTIREGLEELGEELACWFFENASIAIIGNSIPGEIACVFVGSKPGGGGCGRSCRKPPPDPPKGPG